MTSKKVYLVTIEQTVDMAVVAESQDQARAVALAHFDEALINEPDPDVDVVRACHIRAPGVLGGTLPYLPLDEIPFGDPRRNWTVAQWIEEANREGQ